MKEHKTHIQEEHKTHVQEEHKNNFGPRTQKRTDHENFFQARTRTEPEHCMKIMYKIHVRIRILKWVNGPLENFA